MSKRGYSLIELLVSLVILAIALGGLLALWTFCFGVTVRSQDYGIGYNIARQEMERARHSTYAFVGTTAPHSYDPQGNPITAGAAAFTATTEVAPIGTVQALKQAVVKVRSVATEEIVFETTTYFTQGGI